MDLLGRGTSVKMCLEEVHHRCRVFQAVRVVPAIRLHYDLHNAAHGLVGIPDLVHVLVVGYSGVSPAAD